MNAASGDESAGRECRKSLLTSHSVMEICCSRFINTKDKRLRCELPTCNKCLYLFIFLFNLTLMSLSDFARIKCECCRQELTRIDKCLWELAGYESGRFKLSVTPVFEKQNRKPLEPGNWEAKFAIFEWPCASLRNPSYENNFRWQNKFSLEWLRTTQIQKAAQKWPLGKLRMSVRPRMQTKEKRLLINQPDDFSGAAVDFRLGVPVIEWDITPCCRPDPLIALD